MTQGIGTGLYRALWVGGLCVGLAIGACSSKDDAKDPKLSACSSCASEKCPDESAACDQSATCKTLRSCELACASGDAACKNECTKSAASDANALVAAANLLQCASLSCGNACWGSSGNTGVGGQTSAPHGGTSSTGSGGTYTSGGTVATGLGGSSSPPLQCKELLDWAAACVVSTDPVFRNCNSSPPTLCQSSCYENATCDDYDQYKTSASGDLKTCLTACDLANGAALPVTCANAKAKRLLCGITVDLACSDADPVDQCLSKCALSYPCDKWEAPMGQAPTAFENCSNGCDASVGATSPNFVVSEGGYVTTLSWQGYAWTGTDGKSSTTITPADFSTLPAGRQLCASGTVPGTADYSAVAMLGFNLSQDPAPADGTAPAPSTWSPLDSDQIYGLTYNITNRAGTPLRIQIQGPNGKTDPKQRWCADVDGQSGSIFWHAFNTECWEGGNGTAYNGIDPLASVMVLVPGDLTSRSFDFCIYEILNKH